MPQHSNLRKPLGKAKSKKQFSKGTKKVHGKNGQDRPMRGGYRL